MRTFFRLCLLVSAGAFPALSDDLHEVSLRGFIPSGTYHVSDLEAISTSSGNLSIHLPLVSLPPGHKGLSAGISLIYNSRLWDADASVFTCGAAGTTPSSAQTVLVPGGGGQGPWSYGYRYSLRVIDTNDQYTGSCTISCPSTSAAYRYRYELISPDGATHELTPNAGDYLNGSWNINPSGGVSLCGINGAGVPTLGTSSGGTPPILYTTDGTYLRIEPVAGTNLTQFTVYFPDGKTLKQLPSGSQVLSDCRASNCNSITFDGQFNVNSATYNFAIGDDQQRTIKMSTAGNVDTITARGFPSGGSAVDLNWTVTWKTISSTLQYQSNTLPGNTQSNSTNYQTLQSLNEVSTVAVPAQLANASGIGALNYQFTYGEALITATDGTQSWSTSNTGELRGMTLPTGASVAYTYTQDGTAQPRYDQLQRNTVKSKTVTFASLPKSGSQVTAAEVWNYSLSSGTGTQSTVTNPDGSTIQETFNAGLMTSRTMPDGEFVSQVWYENFPFQQASTAVPVTTATASYKATNPYVAQEFRTLPVVSTRRNPTAITLSSVDRNGNSTSKTHYDWVDRTTVYGSSGNTMPALPGSLTILRNETRNFYGSIDWTSSPTDPCSAGALYRCSGKQTVNALQKETITGTGTNNSVRELCYDFVGTAPELRFEARWDSQQGALPPVALINCATGATGAAANTIVSSWEYDTYGNVTKEVDPGGSTTTYTRTAMPTCSSVSGGTPSFASPYVSQMAKSVNATSTQTWSYSTDCATGLRKSETDPNQVSTSYTFDALGRLTQLQTPTARVQRSYADDQRYVITKQDVAMANDGLLLGVHRFDEMGRPSLTQVWESAGAFNVASLTGGIQTAYLYSNLTDGDFTAQSNPYRGSSPDGWSMSYRDPAGRTLSSGAYSGATAPSFSTAATGAVVSYTYDGELTRTTAEDGTTREVLRDPLNRTIQVNEPSGANGAMTTTAYTFDGLGNLSTVCENVAGGVCGKSRSFSYNSLSRLASANNPESGLISYLYFKNGTVQSKADARNTVTYSYDLLHRVTLKTYSGSDAALTPNVNFCYDGALWQSTNCVTPTAVGTNSVGRMTSVSTAGSSSTSGSTTDFLGFDSAGRVTQSRQNTDGIAFGPFGYQYAANGTLTRIVYPSGRTVSYGLDSMGRVNGVGRGATAPDAGSATPADAYAWGIGYEADGKLSGLRYGTTNARYASWTYNFRRQMTSSKVGSTGVGGDVWSLTNDFGVDTSNTGNVMWQYLSAGNANVISTAYHYDAVHRLDLAAEKLGTAASSFTASCPDSGSVWCFQYGYDVYGNRLIGNRGGAGSGASYNEAGGYTASTNQISGGVWHYDARGNIDRDGSGAGMVWDAENRVVVYCRDGGDELHGGDGWGGGLRI